MSGRDTVDDTSSGTARGELPQPGIVLVQAGPTPVLRALALSGGRIALGRDSPACSMLDDEKLSRHHTDIALDGTWRVSDAGSRNGTFVDGVRVEGSVDARAGAVVRAGGTVAVLAADVRPLAGARVVSEGALVKGPCFTAILEEAARGAAAGETLLVAGESGTGKEIVARAFWQALPRARGEFVAVNCATIPAGVAERLLFGAKRGAYSGAMGDVEGYVQAADGGVLFLDEIGELDAPVQAKLLRVIENKEVSPLGSVTAHKVSTRFCAATHRDLRAEVAAGRFRDDLFFRLAEREVVIPALRQRREEIPWLVAAVLQQVRPALRAHPRLVEACLLRPWPGNVRELAREVRHAAQRVEHGDVVRPELLRPEAGAALTGVVPVSEAEPHRVELSRDAIEAALARESGNISAAARALGLHRTQLRRTMQKLGVRARH